MANRDDPKIKALMQAFMDLNSSLENRRAELRNLDIYEQNSKREYESKVMQSANKRGEIKELERRMATSFRELETLFLDGYVLVSAEEPDYNSRTG